MKGRTLVVCLLAAVSASAQSSNGITVSGSIRSRVYGWDWFQPDSGDNSYAYAGNVLRIGLSQSRESWDWTAEFEAPLLFGLPTTAVAPGVQGALGLGANYFTGNQGARNAAMLFPKQLNVRFTHFGGRGSVLKIGRFDFADGGETTPKSATLAALKRDRINQRLIGGFGWSDVGRSFDGMHYSYTGAGGTLTVVGAVPTRGVFQVDGWGWNRVAFGYASFARPWGSGSHSADTRVFAIYYDDFRGVLKTDNRPVAARRGDVANLKIWTFGGHSVHAVETGAGTIDVLLWGAAQTGRWGVQDQRAHAIDVEAGIQPKVLRGLKPWLRGGFYDGSGDGNPNDNVHGTFFGVLPTPRPFARFPFFDMLNNRDTFGILMLRPHAKVTVSSEFHALRLSNANDLWYAGGGVFQPWTFGYSGRATNGRRSLANLYDSSVEYRVNRHATFTGYLGYAQGKAVMAAIYPRGTDGKFGYLEALYKF